MNVQRSKYDQILMATLAAFALAHSTHRAAGEDATPSPSAPAEAVVLTGRTMGTTYRIKYWGDGTANQLEVRTKVDQALDRFDRQMSTYRDDSELSRFNRTAAKKWFPVSSATAHVVREAIEYQRLTGGALDVSVAPLLRAWHFEAGAEKQNEFSPPGEDELRRAMELIGDGRLDVRADPPSLWKDKDGVEVDLSAIAPGYAVDLLVELLKSLGFRNAMVEIGGEVRGAGTRPDGTPWRIGVERVEQTGAPFAAIVPLKNLALSTAGDYRNFRTAGGACYTHIVDPRTGQALPYRGVAVSVVANSCLTSDALDTALLVMGADAGYRWCVKHKVAALFQTRGADGAIVERTTPRFDELMGNE